MTAPELLTCPFCGTELHIAVNRLAWCKTQRCILFGRIIDLDVPGDIARWNTRADLHSPEVLALVTAAREMFEGGSRAAWNSLSAALAAFQEVK